MDKYRQEMIQQHHIYYTKLPCPRTFNISFEVHMHAHPNNEPSWRYFSSSSTTKMLLFLFKMDSLETIL